MKRRTIALALLLALLLSACGTPAPAATPETPASPLPTAEATTEPAPTATPEPTPAPTPELSAGADLEGLKRVDDVLACLETALADGAGERLIPYAADLYHAGDNTATWKLMGFCTADGRIVTKPVFAWIALPTAGDCYLAEIAGQPELVAMVSPDGALLGWANEPFTLREPAGDPVPLPGGDWCDDGSYYLDGCVCHAPEGEDDAWGELAYSADGYRILRSSDGSQAAETDWPGLIFCDLPDGGRVYFTLEDGVCCTYDAEFRPILRVRALSDGHRSRVTVFSLSDAPVTAPTEKGRSVALSAEQQYEANVFLSNFSEQNFCGLLPFEGFEASEAGVAQLFGFAHLWAKINRHSAIGYEGEWETMTREDYVGIVCRYFDLDEVPMPAEGEDFTAALGLPDRDWSRCWYENGKFYYPAADGESYNRFTVVDTATLYSDNRWSFTFTVYELDLDVYWDDNGIPDAYYRLTPQQAGERAAAGELTARGSGTAFCEPCYLMQSGRDSYRLIRYELDPPPQVGERE